MSTLDALQMANMREALDESDGREVTCCPACFSSLAWRIAANEQLCKISRTAGHDFWNTCAAALAKNRTKAETSALRTRLAANLRACDSPEEHVRYPKHIKDPVNLFFDALYTAMMACLLQGDGAMAKRRRRHNGFRSHRDHWPTSFNQIFPQGDQRVELVVDWCSSFVSHGPIMVLNLYLTICRPRILPYIMAQPTRGKLVWTIVRFLIFDLQAPLYEWPGAEPRRIPAGQAFPNTVRAHHDAVSTICQIVGTIMSGPDYKMDDIYKFAADYELVLFNAVQTAIEVLDKRFDKTNFDILQKCALLLHKRLGLPDFFLEPRVRRWKRVNRLWQTAPSSDEYIGNFFAQQAIANACAAPGCGSVVQATEARRFSKCSKCEAVSYCSKECQLRDWKEGFPCPLPDDLATELQAAPASKHKAICPIIARIRAGTASAMTASAFQSGIASTHLTQDERRTVVMWIVSRRVLPPRAAVQLLGLVCAFSVLRVSVLTLPKEGEVWPMSNAAFSHYVHSINLCQNPQPHGYSLACANPSAA